MKNSPFVIMNLMTNIINSLEWNFGKLFNFYIKVTQDILFKENFGKSLFSLPNIKRLTKLCINFEYKTMKNPPPEWKPHDQ